MLRNKIFLTMLMLFALKNQMTTSKPPAPKNKLIVKLPVLLPIMIDSGVIGSKWLFKLHMFTISCDI